MAITPEQMGFPHVVQLARLDRIRELKSGRQEVETVWIITSLGPEKADAARLLELARQYWSIESGTHHRLDVSSGEDRCRVRHPVAATVLGVLRRAVQGEYRAWAASPAQSAGQHLSGLPRDNESARRFGSPLPPRRCFKTLEQPWLS
jgi:hypothetical protein